ncbi:MAG: OmpL47-type beta-barrel domain-containing protein [Thermoplasmata archaeon]
MKNKIIILVLVLVIALLLPAIPNLSYTAKAAAAMSVSPTSGIVGTSVTVSMTGLTASTTYNLYMEDSAGNQVGGNPIASITTTATQTTATVTFSIPPATEGTATIFITQGGYSAPRVASTYFAVSTSLSVSPSSGNVGSSMTLTGNGYGKYLNVNIFWDGKLYWQSTTNRTGSFILILTVPYGYYGLHTIYAQDSNTNSASTNFFIDPNIIINPSSGYVFSSFTAYMTGYSQNASLSVIWVPLNTIIGTGITDANGTLNLTVNVPQSPAGSSTVESRDSNGVSSTATFLVIPQIILNVSSGPQGTAVKATGYGFAATASITSTWDNPALTLFTTASNSVGTWSNNFLTPPATFGNHVITATDGTNTQTATFFVSSQLKLSPYWGSHGTKSSVNATGLSANVNANVIWDPGQTTQATLVPFTTNSTGSSSYVNKPAITVPTNAAPGKHVVEVVDANGVIASTYFYVGPVFTLSEYKGNVSDHITVEGYAYPANTAITVYWGSKSNALATKTTDTRGDFNVTITIPYGAEGQHMLITNNTNKAGTTAYNNFTIIPHIYESIQKGYVYNKIAIIGTGFGANEIYNLYWNGIETPYNNISNNTGSLNISYQIPPTPYGNSTIAVENTAYNLYSNILYFFVQPSLNVKTSVYSGETVSMLGLGYSANSAVTVTWDNVVQNAWSVSGNNGTVNINFVIPSSSASVHYINAYDSAFHFANKVAVNVLSPIIPLQISPLNGSYINATPILSWSSVPYASSYTIQYSTTSTFSAGYTTTVSGLTGTSYTISNLPNNVYYWHVEAIDNHGNPSGYSVTWKFTYDTVPPTSAINPLPRWENSLKFNIYYTSSDSESGVFSVALYYNYNGGNFVKYKTIYSNVTPNVFTFNAIDGNGTYSFYTIATDRAGNVQAIPTTNDTYTTVIISSPYSTVLSLPKYESTSTFNIYYEAYGNAPIKGVYLYYSNNSITWSVYGNTLFTKSPISFTAPQNGPYYFYTIAVDVAGNVQKGNVSQAYTIVDTSQPITSIYVNGTLGNNSWYTTPVSIKLSSSDIYSGVMGIYYTINNTQYEYTSPFTISLSGVYNITYWGVSSAGVVGIKSSETIKIDLTTPYITYSISGKSGMNGWYTGGVIFNISAYDNYSGIASTYMKVNNGNWYNTKSVEVYSNGNNEVYYYAMGVDGVSSGIESVQIKIDTSQPITSIYVNGTLGNNSWYTTPVSIKLSSSDIYSGVMGIYYTINNTQYEYTSPFTISLSGVYNITYWGVSSAGVVGIKSSEIIKIDLTTPYITYSISGKSGMNGWYTGGVIFNISAYDNYSGIASTYMKVNNGNWYNTKSVEVYSNGNNEVYYYAMGVDGVSSGIESVQIKIDFNAPISQAIVEGNVTPSGWYKGNVNIFINSTDNVSGISNTYYSINNGSWVIYHGYFTISNSGTYTIRYYAENMAGNKETVKTLVISIEANPATILAITPAYNSVNTNSVNITSTVFDRSGIKAVYIKIDNGPWFAMNYTAYNNTGGVAYYIWHTNSGDNGIHIIQIKVIDNVGYSYTKEFTLTVNNFNILPIVFIVILIVISILIVVSLYLIRKHEINRIRTNYESNQIAPINTNTSAPTSESNKIVENEVRPAETTQSKSTTEQTNKNEESSKQSVDNVEPSNLTRIKGKKKGKNESKNDNETNEGVKQESNITQKEGDNQ